MTEKNTSERVSPEQYSKTIEDYLIYLMHKVTYEFALSFVQRKNVLDLGCGDGYGEAIIAGQAAHVTAVDINNESINNAIRKYSAANITFQTIAPIEKTPLPFNDQSFDIVLSFQVIEHIADVEIYLKEINRVLKKNGTLIVSTPNAAIRLLPLQAPWNKFHIKEFSKEELTQMLTKVFTSVQVTGLSLKEPWLSLERQRTNRNKWILWPFTLKFIPTSMRKILLHGIGNMTSLQKKESAPKTANWPAADVAIITDTDVDHAPSLVGICRKKDNAQ